MNTLVEDLIKATEERVKAELHFEAAQKSSLDERAYMTKLVNLRALESKCVEELEDYLTSVTRMSDEGGV